MDGLSCGKGGPGVLYHGMVVDWLELKKNAENRGSGRFFIGCRGGRFLAGFWAKPAEIRRYKGVSGRRFYKLK